MMFPADSDAKGLLYLYHICICVAFVSYVYRIYIDSDQWFGIMMFPADSGAKG